MSSTTRRKKQENKTSLVLSHFEPITNTQDLVFDEFQKGQHISLHGYAGTGKTIISMYLALKAIEEGQYLKLRIFRSPVASRAVGHLPGNLEEKMEVFEAPYKDICSFLYNRDDAYEILKQKKIIEFDATSFVRGMTFDDSVIFLDEFSNCNLHEISSIITRCGENTRLIISGDYRQSDLKFDDEKEGIHQALKRLKKIPSISHIEFKIDDIVRSSLVKEWILSEFD